MPPVFFVWIRTRGVLHLSHVNSLGPLGPTGDLKLYFLSLCEGFKPLSSNGGVVHKDVGSTFLGDKAVALAVVEPLHSSFSHIHSSPPFAVGTSSCMRSRARCQHNQTRWWDRKPGFPIDHSLKKNHKADRFVVPFNNGLNQNKTNPQSKINITYAVRLVNLFF